MHTENAKAMVQVMQEFQVLRFLQPPLRMKAQADSNNRGRKDFLCRKEKRKTA
jgi:hypothetical protein